MQVWPKNDDIRRVIQHPTGVKFRAEGPVDWPGDSYTHRRIADGDVTTEDPNAPPPETQSTRRGPRAERAEPRHES